MIVPSYHTAITGANDLEQKERYEIVADEGLLLLLLFLTFSVLVANPKKLHYTVANPARDLLNREKRTKEKVWQHTPPPHPPHCSFGENKKITRRIYRRYAGLGRSRVRTRIPSARRLGQWVWLRKFYTPLCDNKFPSLVASLFSWRGLAASTSSFLHAAMNLRPLSVTVSTHTSAFKAVAFWLRYGIPSGSGEYIRLKQGQRGPPS